MTDLKHAADYQTLTAYDRGKMPGGEMDWSNQPKLYKNYIGAETFSLPRDLTLPRLRAWQVLTGSLNRPPQTLDISSLARLLFMSYAFTGKVDYGTEPCLYRSVPSAGALYPTEVYLAAAGLEGLDDGLYHYSLMDFGLTLLRHGAPPDGVPCPAIIMTGLFFRSGWKYRQRAFRYCLMDTGHLAENMTLTGPALGLSTEFTADFDDKEINAYLGLDTDKETALAVVRLAPSPDRAAAASTMQTDAPEAENAAPREEIFDLITAAARLTSDRLTGQPEAGLSWPKGETLHLADADWPDFEGPSLMEVLQKRRSRRNFRPNTLKFKDVSRLLNLLNSPDLGVAVNLSLVTNEVEDIRDGCHHYDPASGTLIKHRSGFISPNMGDAALSQDWLGRANLILVLSAPLRAMEEAAGPRALRHAYLAAGRIGQRAYLAAETMGWGCCGVGAFYDEDVKRLLNLPPGEEPLYLVGVGPVKKRTHGGRPEAE